MAIHASLRDHLTNDITISPVVGNRVYANDLPRNKGQVASQFPCIVMHQISHVSTHSHNGPSGYAEYRMQLNIWAKTFDEAEQLSHLVRAALDGYRGSMPSLGDGQITVESCFLDSEDFDVEDGGDGRDLHLARQDFLIAVLE